MSVLDIIVQIYEKISNWQSKPPGKAAILIFGCVYLNLQIKIVKFLTKMRRIGLILIAAAGLAACTTTAVEEDAHKTQGEVSIVLRQDDSVIPVKASEGTPDVNDFIVEIKEMSTDRLFFRKTYAEAQGMTIPLNAGEHRLYAYYGDSQKAGFNAFHYVADTVFNVQPAQLVKLDAVARMANVKVAVNFGEGLRLDHDEYYADVVASNGAELTFVKTEKRAGYVPAGELSLNLYIYVQGQWMVYKTAPVTCEPQDFITFNVDTRRFGDLTVEIVIDDGVDTVIKEISVPAAAAPQDGPSLSVSGFENNRFSAYEADGRTYEGFKADIVAMGGVQSCVLEINSSYLQSKGLPASVDLAAMDAHTEELLKANGIKCLKNMSGCRLAYVDFSGLVTHVASSVPYNSQNGNSCADLRLHVTDKAGKTVSSETYTLAVDKSVATLSFNDCDIYATKLLSPVLTVEGGDPSKFVLKCVAANDMLQQNIKVVSPLSISGNTVTFPAITGLNGGTSYRIWAVYNNNSSNSTTRSDFTTENIWQFPNSGFEQWTEFKHTFKRSLASSVDYYWHKPYSGTQYWDVNAKVSMPSSGLAATNPNVKCFPCAGRSTDSYSGSYSALIMVTNVGDWNTDNTAVETSYIGQLFIGTADDGGNPTYGTVACQSRPSALKFHYKYVAKSNSQFSAELKLNSSEGVLATGTVTGGAASSWTEMTVPLTYTSEKTKAANISLVFLSTTTDVGVNTKTTIEYNGGSYTGHFGPQLRVDNLRLIYE